LEIEADSTTAHAIVGAMAAVATAGGKVTLTEADRVSLTAAHRYMLRQEGPLDIGALSAPAPADLADRLDDAEQADKALKMLAVMALVDGTVAPAKIALLESYAEALGRKSDYLQELAEAAQGHLRWAGMDMVRHNMLSITGQPWADDDVMPWLLPYQGANADEALADRYRGLAALPAGTLGHSFWQWYDKHGFAFPGEADALNEAFAVPHDSTHLISGYSTSYRGEILVSTFTAGMHPEEPMAGHILPVIFSWHLGVELIEHAGAHKGALDPEAFWQAWRRGQDTAGDLFARDWDFWSVAEVPLAELQERYGVPPLVS